MNEHKKALITQGLKWWRWRESNTGPMLFDASIHAEMPI